MYRYILFVDLARVSLMECHMKALCSCLLYTLTCDITIQGFLYVMRRQFIPNNVDVVLACHSLTQGRANQRPVHPTVLCHITR